MDEPEQTQLQGAAQTQGFGGEDPQYKKQHVQEATCAKEKSCSQKGTEWHTHDKDIKTKVVFHKTKTIKRPSGIGLKTQHRKVFGLLDTQGVWGGSAITLIWKSTARNEPSCSALANSTFEVSSYRDASLLGRMGLSAGRSHQQLMQPISSVALER